DISPEIQGFLEASVRSDNKRNLQFRTFIILTGLVALFGLASAGYFARLESLKRAARSPMVYFPEGPAVLGYGEKRVERELASVGECCRMDERLCDRHNLPGSVQR